MKCSLIRIDHFYNKYRFNNHDINGIDIIYNMNKYFKKKKMNIEKKKRQRSNLYPIRVNNFFEMYCTIMNIVFKYDDCFKENFDSKKERKKRWTKELKYLDKLINIQPNFGKRKIDHLYISSVCTFYLD